MLNQNTLERIRDLGLSGLLSAIEEQIDKPDLYRDLSFDERLGLAIDREYNTRNDRRMNRLVAGASFRFPNAAIEDVRFKASRGFDKKRLLELAELQWVKSSRNLIVTGPTGAGKSYLACALGVKACLAHMTVMYYRTPSLLLKLHEARAQSCYPALIKKLKKAKLLIVDDFAHSAFTESEEKDVLEVVEERYGCGSIIVTSQLPVEKWHATLPNPTLADAILDRIVQKSERLPVEGETQR